LSLSSIDDTEDDDEDIGLRYDMSSSSSSSSSSISKEEDESIEEEVQQRLDNRSTIKKRRQKRQGQGRVETETNRLKLQLADLKSTIEDIDAKTEEAERRIELLTREAENGIDGDDAKGGSATIQIVIDRLMARLSRENEALSRKLTTNTQKQTQIQTSTRSQLEIYLNETRQLKSTLQTQITALKTQLKTIQLQTTQNNAVRETNARQSYAKIRSTQRAEDKRQAVIAKGVRSERRILRFDTWDLESRLKKVRYGLLVANSKSGRGKREDLERTFRKEVVELEEEIERASNSSKQRIEALEGDFLREELMYQVEEETNRLKVKGLVEKLRGGLRRREEEVRKTKEGVRKAKEKEMVCVKAVAEEDVQCLLREKEEEIEGIATEILGVIELERRQYDSTVRDFEARAMVAEKEGQDEIDMAIGRMQGKLEGVVSDARVKKDDMIRDKETAIKLLEVESVEAYAKLVLEMTGKVTLADRDIIGLQEFISERNSEIEFYEAERRSLRTLIKFAITVALQRPIKFIRRKRGRSSTDSYKEEQMKI